MPPELSNDCCARPDVTALILAAGSGTRLGGIAKATLEYQGGSLLQHAIALVAPFAGHIIVGTRAQDLDWAQEQCRRVTTDCSVTCVTGGATRQESLERLLDAAQTEFLIVHEVARPWVEPDVFRQLLCELRECSAVALYTPLPVRDGLALMEDRELKASLPRANVVSVQTPQVYRRAALRHAYALAKRHGWQEESTIALMARAKARMRLIEGSPQNVKVTYPEDLAPLRMLSAAPTLAGAQQASG
ncbi:IspD/TarI family cytidylyltransferase [Opitutus terrae]|uniref:2-C-methyl-D-erythritol 4-phosphate cytidylyltransferase n=1 Tax=Opitutus terrae (strain DSM 11246 / JCM 15787 / PB90-1) TaxID=452637 RepID=B2A095_OPITP|nr:2-C-methyl-D-erythritol 4-phosphate cytidylyltransferase [Opitutus terrae]ACB77431.1 2-C-methyl-D-erythritol 4-phosphate cytidylyltransferase [Opitutus terrae PB90-1]